MLQAHFNQGAQEVCDEIARQDYGFSVYGAEAATNHYRTRCAEFDKKLQRKVKFLQEVARVERQAATPAPVDPEPNGPQWDNAHLVVAIYALLRAARIQDPVNKSAVARFAVKLTGRSEQKLRTALSNATGSTFTDDVAKDVATAFEELGLRDVAQDVLNKLFT